MIRQVFKKIFIVSTMLLINACASTSTPSVYESKSYERRAPAISDFGERSPTSTYFSASRKECKTYHDNKQLLRHACLENGQWQDLELFMN